MSKRSRRRNKKILGALLLGGLGLAAANRGKGTGVSGSDKAKFTSDAAYSIPGGDEGSFKVQDVKVNVPKTNNNIFRTRHRITDSAGNTIPSGKGDYVQRAKDAAAAKNMRAFRSNRAYRGDMMTTPDSIIEGMDPLMISAKKGGRIVKGKKTAVRKVGIAKRGFGRAMKRSK